MITIFRFLCRPPTTVPTFPTCRYRSPSNHYSSTQLFLLSQEKLTKGRLGISLNVIRSSSMNSSTSPVEAVAGEGVLEAKNDEHGGVIVEMTTEPLLDPIAYASSLKTSLSHWRNQGKRGIWIKLPIELANLVEPTVKEGFYFHHAEPNYLMLSTWLPATPNTLPANASHRVGIGAFVLNEKNEVLVVQEKCGRFRGTGIWKFPTGVVDEGEDICAAAVREVKEETGIDSEFLEILAFRQSHKAYFEKSDLFFVCMMKPLSKEIMPQESEIEAAQWMPYEEYVTQPFVQKHNLLRRIADACEAKKSGTYTGFSPVPTTTGFSEENAYLYVNSQSLVGNSR